jgi:dCTP deaminase
MAILSAQSIRNFCCLGFSNLCDLGVSPVNLIQPFNERTLSHGRSFGLSSCGYDVRLASAENMTLNKGDFTLGVIQEYIHMPDWLMGHVADKSTNARLGLSVFNTIIEPNWRGYLTVEMVNHCAEPVQLFAGMPIAQILFHQLDEETEKPYNGKYQSQPKQPVKAIME